MYTYNDWRNYQELYHHGVLGQKWGVRRYQNADGSLTNEGKIHYSKNGESKEGFVDPFTAVFTATMAFDAFVIGVGIYQNAKVVAEKKKAEKFEKQCETERSRAETDPKTGLKLQSQRKTREEDLKRVNPSYKLDPDGARSNCTNCTMAYELRRRGYEVQAKLKAEGRNGEKFAKDLFNAENKNIRPIPKDEDEKLRFSRKYTQLAREGKNTGLAKQTMSTLAKEDKGSRGQLLLSWDIFSGHSVAYEVSNSGKVSIVDGQSGTIYEGKKAEEFISHAIATRYQRLDNLDFDAEKIKEAVR